MVHPAINDVAVFLSPDSAAATLFAWTKCTVVTTHTIQYE
jgi:hypothetical protein